MKPGTILKWSQFPYPKSGKKKDRWFIYLGKTSLLSTPILAHLCTTTTNIAAFKMGGERQRHDHKIFTPEKYPFDEECVLDFDERPYSVPEEKLKNNPDIKVKGALTEPDLRMIYNRILKSPAYSKQIILDIHSCCNAVGIINLKKPKR